MSNTDTFSTWLNDKLRELKTDESIFGSYITGILEGDETQEEKSEAIEGILSEIIEHDLEELIATIIAKWNECQPKKDDLPKNGVTIDVDAQLTKLLEAQKLQTTVREREQTAEERRIRQQILAQYAQTAGSDDEEDTGAADSNIDEPTKSTSSSIGGGLVRNNNANDVLQAQKERREQSRLDCAAKKQKDKEDRERQKQQREEKKEKRKTVKGERRR